MLVTALSRRLSRGRRGAILALLAGVVGGCTSVDEQPYFAQQPYTEKQKAWTAAVQSWSPAWQPPPQVFPVRDYQAGDVPLPVPLALVRASAGTLTVPHAHADRNVGPCVCVCSYSPFAPRDPRPCDPTPALIVSRAHRGAARFAEAHS